MPWACEDSIPLLADMAEGMGAPLSPASQAALPMPLFFSLSTYMTEGVSQLVLYVFLAVGWKFAPTNPPVSPFNRSPLAQSPALAIISHKGAAETSDKS